MRRWRGAWTLAAALLAALLSDGGGGLFVPAGVWCGASAGGCESPPLAGGARSSPALIVAEVVERPSSIPSAVRLVQEAYRHGWLPQAKELFAAVRRRAPLKAAALARAEIAGLQGDKAGLASALADARTSDRTDAARRFLQAYLDARAGRRAQVPVALGALQRWTSPERSSSRARPSNTAVSIPRLWMQRRDALVAVVLPDAGQRLALRRLSAAVRSVDVDGQVRALLSLAAIQQAAGHMERARVMARRARNRSRHGVGRILAFLVRAQLGDLGVPPRRAEVAPDCEALAARGGVLEAECQLSRLATAMSTGRYGAAVQQARIVGPLVSGTGTALQRLRLASLLVPLYWAVGSVSAAERWAAQSISLAGELGQLEFRAQFRLWRAGLLRALGRVDAAARQLAEAESDAGLQQEVLALERTRLAMAGGSSEEATRIVAGLTRRPDSIEAVTARLELGVGTPSDRRLLLRQVRRRAPRMPAPARELLLDAVRGRLHEANGFPRMAAASYRQALSSLQEWLRQVPDPAARVALTQGWRQLAERLAALELERGDPARALSVLSASESPAPGLGLQHLQGHLGVREAVVVIAAVDTQPWVWVIRRNTVHAVALSCSAERIRQLSQLWLAGLRGDLERWRRVGRTLADATLGAVLRRGWLRHVDTVVIIPSLGLEAVAIDALSEPSGGGLLGERFVFARAPSLAALDRAFHQPRRRGDAVAFVPGSAADAAEARAVLHSIPGQSYTGPRATRIRFLQEAPGSGVIHFGGHAVAPREWQVLGGIQLRSGPGDDGFVSWADIARLALGGSVAVLLGCDTAGRAGAIGPGAVGVPTSLSEAFLSAGSRSVVGSLWEMDARVARQLAREFYAAGGPLAGAGSLQRAKLRLRSHYPEAPRLWAAAVWDGVPGPTVR